MAPSLFRSTAVVCSIVTASLGFGLLTPAVAVAATPTPSSSSAPQESPVDGIRIDPSLAAVDIQSIVDTASGSRAVMGFAGQDEVYLLAGDTVVDRWPGGPGLVLLRALDSYSDRQLDVVRVHTAADGTQTRTERTPLPRTLRVDGLSDQNVFTPGTKTFGGSASTGATIMATSADGTQLFSAEVRGGRTAVGQWSAEAELSAADHTVTFTQTLPGGRSSVIRDVTFTPASSDAPAAPEVRASERRLDGTFALSGRVDARTTSVEVRDASGAAIGETRLQDGEFAAVVPQDHVGASIVVVAVAADGAESTSTRADLDPLPVDAAVAAPSVHEVNVLPTGAIQVIGEQQQTTGLQVLDGERVVAHVQPGDAGWTFNVSAQHTGKQLDLVQLSFDGQRYTATSERVHLPRLLAVDGLATENTYTPGDRRFTGSAEAGATIVATDQDGQELFRTGTKANRSGVATWAASADLTSDEGYELTFTQTTTDGRTSVMKNVTFTPQDADGLAAPTAEGYFPEDVAHWAGVSGLAVVGGEVVVHDADGDEIGRTTVEDPTGLYNIGIDPAKVGYGVQELTVTQVVDDETSPASTTRLDYGQNAPAFTDPVDDSAISGSGLAFAGSGDSGGEVTLNGTDFRDTTTIGSAKVVDGAWEITNDELELPAGSYQLWAMQRTKGGKAEFTGVNVRVQSTAMTAEGYFPEDVAQWAGVAGFATVGSDVVARDLAGTEIGRTRVEDPRGMYNIGVSPDKVGDGEQTLVITQEFAGAVSPAVEVVLDYGSNAPTITSPADGDVIDPEALAFTGAGDRGGSIVLNGVTGADTATIGSGLVDGGAWSIVNDELTLPDGQYQFWAHQRTKGGKISVTGINLEVRSAR